MTLPEFPLRIIFDDGESMEITSPEELMELVDSVDSTAPGATVWVRDALDRTVLLRVRAGMVEEISVV